MSHADLHVTDCPLDRVQVPDASTRTKGPLIAIDLGATSCRVAAMHKDVPTCIPSQRLNGTPSYVALGSGGRILTGTSAQQQMSSVPALAVWGIKGLLGAPYLDPKMRWLYEQLRCPLSAGEDGRPLAQLGDRHFTARELAALLMYEARERAQNFLQQPVYRTVLTLPPTRDNSVRELMTAAAQRAGLHVERILTEPTVVALAAFFKRQGKPERTLMVCDWGGGSFQASLVRVSMRECQVVASDSDVALCGAELDKRLTRVLLQALPPGVKLAADVKNPAAFFRVLSAVEFAKTQVSQAPQARVHVPFATTQPDGQPGAFEAMLTRQMVEEQASPLIDGAIALCGKVLDEQFLLPGEVDEVLLVGEQSRMPLFQERIRRDFVQVPVYADDPGQSVVLGAIQLGTRLEAAATQARTPPPVVGTARR
jgi:molecular chaperone DnaK (HSP70)